MKDAKVNEIYKTIDMSFCRYCEECQTATEQRYNVNEDLYTCSHCKNRLNDVGEAIDPFRSSFEKKRYKRR